MSDIPSPQDLYRLAYVPGSFKCPKCGFTWNKSTLTPDGIGTSETDRQSEACPNDGEWMEAVTYRDVTQSLQERLMEEIPARRKAETTQHALSVALRSCLALSRLKDGDVRKTWEMVQAFCAKAGIKPSMLRSEARKVNP